MVDKNNRYKMMKDLGTNKEEAFYKIGATGPEPHKAMQDNWKEYAKEKKLPGDE